MPLPPAGKLTISDVTHSAFKLTWDASPGKVRKYIITYKPDEGELKEVMSRKKPTPTYTDKLKAHTHTKASSILKYLYQPKSPADILNGLMPHQ